MEVEGLCSICGRPAKLHTCHLCGRLVCSQCMDRRKGVCVKCAAGKKGSVPGSGDAGVFK
ncbi:hypothetical protein [Methanosarcina horonobensis]|uniref:hypothetical protein n=1 Tax=Methanosarcina horonobensis TaxID=418008 RepID=UPI00064E576A|nr:hypothetical protein [Methanosarcina horonobensis]